MKFGVQMDPLEGIAVAGDTSFALMLEAQARGHSVVVFEPRDVVYEGGVVRAHTRTVRLHDGGEPHFEVLVSSDVVLASLDMIAIRQDPPFDTAYLANTFLLEMLEGRVVMLNPPRAIRNFSEKLRALELHRFMPDTFIGSRLSDMRAFAGKHEQVVVKPLFLGGGTSVMKTSATDPQFAERIEALMAEVGREPLIVQAFIPEIVAGDKRVFVIDGEVAGVLRRVPSKGDFRANIHVGGSAEIDVLTPKEEEVCAEVVRLCADEGIVFAGIDLIHGYLNEVNVTSPTLVREFRRLSGIDLAPVILNAMERRVGRRAA